MSKSENVKAENSKPENTEKEKPEAAKKVEPITKPKHGVKVEPTKSDRLDRMEDQLNLIEDGILVLINSTQWANLSITPVGTHDPNKLIDGCASLQEAINLLSPEEGEKISQ
jgi:hypothetical protein